LVSAQEKLDVSPIVPRDVSPRNPVAAALAPSGIEYWITEARNIKEFPKN
jgi:hypothetical protein